MTTSHKLIRYFLAHSIIVQTYLPLKQVLYCLDLVGCLKKCVIDFLEFEVSFEAWKTVKAQLLDDFLAKKTYVPPKPFSTWVIVIDIF